MTILYCTYRKLCMYRKFLLGVILFSIIIMVGTTLLRQFPESTSLCKDCNVILISIDMFGAKHSSVHNPELTTTPFLQTLAEENVVFERAYSQAPWTLPSHAAMLTGQYPWNLNVWDISDSLPSNSLTLAEALQETGYQTAAFSTGSFVQPLMNFDKGFETFTGTSNQDAWNDMPHILNQANDWLNSRDKSAPFFLFIRPFELHYPYGSGEDVHTISDIVALNTKETRPTASEVDVLRDAYRSDIKKTDTALRDFFEHLAQTGELDNTLIIITSDHGVEFGEHGTVGIHSVALYAENIHVPLIVSYPNAPAMRIPYSVEIRSIPATILELVGAIPKESFAGASLVPFIEKKEKKDRLALSLTIHERDTLLGTLVAAYVPTQDELLPTIIPDLRDPYVGDYMFSALQGEWHAIKNTDDSIELYNLRLDGEEKENLGANMFSLNQSLRLSDPPTLVPDILERASQGTRAQ
jgi:arylsulfatase A-like enzyme